jgi:hypothetical protein
MPCPPAAPAVLVNRDISTLVEFASWRSLLEQPTRALLSSSSCTVDVSNMCCQLDTSLAKFEMWHLHR